ncbi:diaminobutyrate--2-oxoglutarate transaminase [Kordia jejudonensis]|uniref:diaminobutyrate--2-oxoglutarate transaminase n=1 Tax=Kordia jejudonensis TaxID=1348245 RepID=UPI0009E3720C|nr:diaminobutyrate--2-oxoglutarate transaminase [Kordia jejudonensis]
MHKNSNTISEKPIDLHHFASNGKSGNEKYLHRQRKFESNARSYPRRIPIAIKEAQDIYVTDVEGNQYIDCLSGAGSLALGHNHPCIHEAIQKCIDTKLPLLTLDITTPIKDKFVETLFGILPKGFRENAKVQFCSPCGADAIEAAIKLTKIATGRSSVFAFSGSYHGMTNGALSLTANTKVKDQALNLMKDVFFMPFPYSYRCPFGVGGVEAEKISLHYIENLLSDSHSGVLKPAAFILEAVQGEGGTIVASPYWLQGIRRITKKYDIPLIVDEVQAGIGRTGDMFAFEEAGITPDVIVISKAIGGSLPLSLIVYRDHLDKWTPGSHAGTFRGNQMAMATGTAVLNYITKHQLVQNSKKKGIHMLKIFNEFKALYPFIGDVRGRGLMLAIEIVDTDKKTSHLGSYPTSPKLASEIQKRCFDKGLIIETGGRESSVLRLLPPLTLTDEQAKDILFILDEVFKSINKN